MKYASRIFLVLIVSFIAIAAIYLKFIYVETPDIGQITTAAAKESTTKSQNKVLLASIKEQKIYLYMQGKKLIFKHNNQETEFDSWSDCIDQEAPEMYYQDYNNDQVQDVLIKYYLGKDADTQKSIYGICALLVTVNDDKTESYNVISFTHSRWSEVLNGTVNQELSQLVSCPKKLQFSMINASEHLKYDSKTGVAKNGYSNYALALKKNDTEYATVESWRKGEGYFSIVDGKVHIDIDVFVKYKEFEKEQLAGQLHVDAHVSKDHFDLTGGTLYFKALDKYKVSRPNKTDVSNWEYVLKNSSVQSTSSNSISFITKSFNIDKNLSANSASFASDTGQSKYIDSIKVCKNKVVLYSKIDKPFSKSAIKKGDFSVVINEGTDDEYEISYFAAVSTNNKNQSVLTIKFDRYFQKSEISSIKINYGA